MPAAEPARTGHDNDVAATPPAGSARIIHLAPHRTTGRNGAAARSHRGGAEMSQPAPPPPADDSGDEAILRPLAEMLEGRFTERHLTLADPRTRDAFDVAMDIAVTVIGGAHAQGIIDDGQREHLAALLEGARRAGHLAADG